MRDYLIVGAGLFGSVFAHEAVKRGRSCTVIDRRGHIGGNCFTSREHGINVHEYGAHIFHTSDRRVWDYINQFAEFNGFINSPLAVYRGEIYNLPFNMNTFSRMWNIRTPDEAREIIARQTASLSIGEPSNLEEQALKMAGTDIYEKLIKGYTEKQWGRSCRELPAFIIRRVPLRFTYDNNYFSDRYQGIPEGGYTPVFEKLLSGAEVLLNTDYSEYAAAHAGEYRKTVYTGMIDEFFGFSLGRLAYRSLRFEKETLPTENFQGNAVVNYTDSAVPYTRMIEHKHFERSESPVTVVSREYPVKWEPGMEPYYPVNDDANNALYSAYARLAEQRGDVIFGGRLGTYMYYDMDKVIAQALGAAEKELD